jgi:toxin YoeB
MNIEFTSNTWEDYAYWLVTDLDIANKIRELIRAIQREPFKGLGKPEPLRFGLKGYWSRRITTEHRLVYKVSGTKGDDQKCTIIQCRFHYD